MRSSPSRGLSNIPAPRSHPAPAVRPLKAKESRMHALAASIAALAAVSTAFEAPLNRLLPIELLQSCGRAEGHQSGARGVGIDHRR